jgi:cytochrome c
MMSLRILAAALALVAAPAFAQEAVDLTPTGDAAAGETQFRQCATCHVVVNDAGETLAGRAARTGPNLYGIAGDTAGTEEGFRYSASMIAAGEQGLIWDEAHFVGYVTDPTPFLREFLGDNSARSNMTYKVRNEADAVNLYAYLHSLAPPEGDGEAATN